MSVPPDQLAELLRASRQNKMATQKMEGLGEQTLRADALRNEAQPGVDRYGNISILGGLANVINKSRGRRDTRNLDVTKEALRSSIGSSAGVLEGQVLTDTFRKRAEEAKRAEEQTTAAQEGTGTYEDRLLTTKQRRKLALKKANMQGKGEDWTKGKVTVGGGVDDNGNPWIIDPDSGERINPIDENWQREDKTYGGYRQGKAMPESAKVVIASNAARIEEVRRTKDNWDSGFGQAYRDLPTQAISGISKALANNDLLKYIDESEDPNVKAAAQWWADWQMFYTADKRHELFGSALTAPEIKSWNEMLNMRPGMDPDEIERRMNTLVDAAERSFRRRANMGMVDPVQGNRDVWERAVGDLLPYDAASNSFGEYGSADDSAEIEAAADAAAWVPPPGLTDTFAGLPIDVQTRIRKIPDPNARAAALEEIMKRNAERNAGPVPSALPQAQKQRFGRGIPQ